MQAEFWLQKWHEGSIGFHRDAALPLLTQHWASLNLPRGSRVLVPLCGKSLDMIWLRDAGLRVLGVELSPLAVQQFLAEHKLAAETRESPLGTHYATGGIEIIQGDVFDLDDTTLAGCDAIYDRAAMIALPQTVRQRYAREIYGRLPDGCRGLLISLEYPQSEMDGPPFSVDEHELKTLLEHHWRIGQMDRCDILESNPDFQQRGLTSLHTGAYWLQRNTG